MCSVRSPSGITLVTHFFLKPDENIKCEVDGSFWEVLETEIYVCLST